VLLLLFTGIDNRWDGVAYHVFVNMRDKDAASQQEKISQRDSTMTPGVDNKVVVTPEQAADWEKPLLGNLAAMAPKRCWQQLGWPDVPT
jgi:hypothetical protein